MLTSDVIRIRNAVFYAYHGVASDEQSLGGKFEIDVELRADLSAASESDDLKRTVDYEAVYGMIHSVVNTIAKGILRSWPVVDAVTVRVRKPHPPVKGVVDDVEVEITKQR
jgi:dihydroneopterin aldolase